MGKPQAGFYYMFVYRWGLSRPLTLTFPCPILAARDGHAMPVDKRSKIKTKLPHCQFIINDVCASPFFCRLARRPHINYDTHI